MSDKDDIINGLVDALLDIMKWVEKSSGPNDRRCYYRCAVCDQSWWRSDEHHKRHCWVPKVKRLGNNVEFRNREVRQD